MAFHASPHRGTPCRIRSLFDRWGTAQQRPGDRRCNSRASLTVGAGRDTPGPLERNVLKNLVAWEFAQKTRQAGRYLAAGDPRSAEWVLRDLRDLIEGLRRQVAGWASDPDLAADQAMLEDYLSVFLSPAAAAQRQYLADSLSYAAFRKLQAAR